MGPTTVIFYAHLIKALEPCFALVLFFKLFMLAAEECFLTVTMKVDLKQVRAAAWASDRLKISVSTSVSYPLQTLSTCPGMPSEPATWLAFILLSAACTESVRGWWSAGSKSLMANSWLWREVLMVGGGGHGWDCSLWWRGQKWEVAQLNVTVLSLNTLPIAWLASLNAFMIVNYGADVTSPVKLFFIVHYSSLVNT